MDYESIMVFPLGPIAAGPPLVRCVSLALRANAVKFHAVSLQLISNPRLHATVQNLLIGNGEILQRAAPRATNMVVPITIGFVARCLIVSLSLP